MKAALIDSSNIVQNIIVWDNTCVAPNGLKPVIVDDSVYVSVGFIHNSDNTFTNPNPPAAPTQTAPAPSLNDIQTQLTMLTAQLNALKPSS